MRRLALVLVLLAASAQAAPPKLIVVVSIDQFPSYYLERYANVIGEDGFKRLTREGTFFVNSAYPYANTFTGPGHASIGTGHTPAESGIVANNWYVWTQDGRMERVYCAQDDNAEPVPPIDDPKIRKDNSRSPLNLSAAGLGDRLQEKDRQSKVYSVSLKDRAAILMGGRKAWGAFWFDGRVKRFMTSTYYSHRLETLVAGFNKTLPARVKKEMYWDLDEKTKAAKVFDPEDLRKGVKSDKYGLGVEFRHPIRDLDALTYTPYGNDLVLDLARAIIRGEQLGADAHPDILFVSLSSTDYLGHAFGPDSWEAADSVVRTDRQLAKFFAELRKQFGGSVTVAVTADHGVQSIPVIAMRKSHTYADRVNMETPESQPRKDLEADAARRLGASAPLNLIRLFDEGAFYLDFSKLPGGVDAEQARRAYRDSARAMAGVADAFTSEQLAMPNPSPSAVERAVRNSFRRDRSGDVLVELKAGYIWDYDGLGTTHGQPVPDDQRVPVMLWGAGIVHGDEACAAGPASPLDLARTLGKLVGVDAGGKLSNDLACARTK